MTTVFQSQTYIRSICKLYISISFVVAFPMCSFLALGFDCVDWKSVIKSHCVLVYEKNNTNARSGTKRASHTRKKNERLLSARVRALRMIDFIECDGIIRNSYCEWFRHVCDSPPHKHQTGVSYTKTQEPHCLCIVCSHRNVLLCVLVPIGPNAFRWEKEKCRQAQA